MTDKKKIALIEELIAHYTRLTKAFDGLESVVGGGVMDCELFNAAYKMFDSYVKNVSEHVGDTWDWVSWYIYDADCGEKDMGVRIDGKRRKCRTVKQLVSIINDANKTDHYERKMA